ncbi:hypothetical protein [Paracidovorax wautersii]|jgi:hypothetical protein|uniref:hypothetical protein n=1 Tax=Paracidovorax wautersii TaxID=1177982 RepID=UPI0031D8D2D0
MRPRPASNAAQRRMARRQQQRQVRDERLALQAQRDRWERRAVPVNDAEPLPRID